jgi:hypothetical protein
MPAERHFRAFARRTVDLPATVSSDTEAARPARLVDLGLGGACIEVPAPLDVGLRVVLEVTAPNLWDPLSVRAKVAWSRASAPGAPASALAGLAFEHEAENALPALVELLFAQRSD